jgi:hypothetical protein
MFGIITFNLDIYAAEQVWMAMPKMFWFLERIFKFFGRKFRNFFKKIIDKN